MNALIGSVQEHKAEKTVSALTKHLPNTVTVIREGEKWEIQASELVRGDVVYLTEGNKISADIRIISSNELYTNDSIITGEPESQFKKALETEEKDLSIIHLEGSVFAGTQVTTGNAIGVVVATGMSTQIGGIATATSEIVGVKSPLQIETDNIAKIIGKAFVLVSILLLFAHFLITKTFNITEGLLFAVQIAAAIVPEGLPATISVALALGARRMAKRKTAIKRLPTVETLGEVTVIVTDKTGTLTKGEMTAKEIFANGTDYEIEGAGYDLGGAILKNNQPIKRAHEELAELFSAAIFANNAEVDTKNHGKTELLGDTTELALLVAAEKAGFDTYSLIHDAKTLKEIPFSSEKKYMCKVIDEINKDTAYFKGAPDVILSMCNKIYLNGEIKELTQHQKSIILSKNNELSKKALRVIAVASKPMAKGRIEENLIFAGLIGLIDPPRPEIKETLKIARGAGIRTIMVTGDHGLTAGAIAQKIGLTTKPRIIEGKEVDSLNDRELSVILKNNDLIFARVDPLHKLRIVKLLQNMKHIVAVTGDGVNDSPALKAADAGIAMGISGTDVSREAADAVLLNDSYSSIIWATREGRVIYENIEKFTKFEFTTHVAALSTVVAGIIMGIMPIFAIQILLMDYGAESFSTFALGTDTEEDDVMSQNPRDRKISLVNKENINYVLRSGIGLAIVGVSVFLIFMINNGWNYGQQPDQALLYTGSALTYATFAICQILNSFSLRSKEKPVYLLFKGNKNLVYAALTSIAFVIIVIYVPGINTFVKMAPLPLYSWAYAIIGSLAFLFYLELFKLLKNH